MKHRTIQSLGHPKTEITTCLFLISIVAISFLVYRPSLNRPLQQATDSDQIWYLAERESTPSFWDGLRLYDYTFSRRFWKGDDVAFRPLLFVWLAVQYAFFSHHYYFWNLTHLTLHMLVMIALYFLLWQIQKSIFAPLITLAVSSLPALSQLVHLHHLGGYFWSFVFLLPPVGILWRMVHEDEVSNRQIFCYVLCLTVACLFYDVIFLMSILMTAYVLLLCFQKRDWQPRYLLFLLPPLIYFLFFLRHYLEISRPFYIDRDDMSSLLHVGNLIRWPENVLRVMGLWTAEVLSPYFSKLGFVIAALGIFAFSRAVSKEHFAKCYPFALLIFCMILTYVGVMSFVRFLARGWYYLYFFCILLTLFFSSCLDFSRIRGKKQILALVVMFLVISKNTYLTHRQEQRLEIKNDRAAGYYSFLSHFVDRGRGTKDFSFTVKAPDEEVDPWIELKEGYPDDKNTLLQRKRLSEILYAPYVSPTSPKYVLRWEGETFSLEKGEG